MGEPEPGGTTRRKRFTTAADPRLPADVLSRLAAQFTGRAVPEGDPAEGGANGGAGAAPGPESEAETEHGEISYDAGPAGSG